MIFKICKKQTIIETLEIEADTLKEALAKAAEKPGGAISADVWEGEPQFYEEKE